MANATILSGVQTRRTEAITLLTAWICHLSPFRHSPRLLLVARLSADAVDLADSLGLDAEDDLLWEFHTRAYLLVQLADFNSIVDATVKAVSFKSSHLTVLQIRKVCDRAAIRARMSTKAPVDRAELCRSSILHARTILSGHAFRPRYGKCRKLGGNRKLELTIVSKNIQRDPTRLDR
jgi:hypothetical protein